MRRYQQEQQLTQQQMALEQANQENHSLNTVLARQIQEQCCLRKQGQDYR